MVIVNKILNILIFLLAIAACVAAVYLHERRTELRGRADYLADIVAKVAEKIDGIEENSSEIDSTKGSDAIVPDLLTWESYHKAREISGKEYIFTKWEDKVSKLPGQTEKLFELKIAMAKNYQIVQEAIKLDLGTLPTNEGNTLTPAEYLQALNSHLSFEEMVKGIPAKIKKVTGRGVLLAAELKTIYVNLQGTPEDGNYDIFSDKDNEENQELTTNLKLISDQASKLFSRSQILAKGYGNIIKAFDASQKDDVNLPQFYKPKFNPDDVLSDNLNTINTAVETLKEDLINVNKMLSDRVVYKAQLDKADDEIKRKDDAIADLNNESDQLKNEIGKVKANNVRISKQLAELKEITGSKRNVMRPGFAAKVLEANDRFDFIVLDKGRKDGVKNLVEMVVHSEGKYICKVLITKVFENSCVCDILPITRPKDAQGNFILPSTGDEAVVPGQ